MIEWFSYAVAIILLLSSIISPIITAIINNRHELKLKKLDMFNEAKRTALNNFINCGSDFIMTRNAADFCEYYKALSKLYIFFDSKDLWEFQVFPNHIKDIDNFKAYCNFTSIVEKLAEQILK